MPRLSSRRVNPGARNIPYTIRGRRDARRAGAWGLAAASGTNTGRQAPGMESTVKHSQLCHLPAAVLSTPISQRTTEIILKPMKGLNLQRAGLAETWEEFNTTVLWMRSQQDAHTSGRQNRSTPLLLLLNAPLSALSSQRDIKAAPDNFCMFAAYSWQLSPQFPEIMECNVIKLEQMATSANLPNLWSFKGPVCPIYWDLLAEMEHNVHNHVFICE